MDENEIAIDRDGEAGRGGTGDRPGRTLRTASLTAGANGLARAMGTAFTQAAVGGRALDDVLKGLALRLSSIALTAAFRPIAQGLLGGFEKMFAGKFSAAAVVVRRMKAALGAIKPFASGGVIGTPTYFPLSHGGVGLAGEAGPEAILPLARGSDGRLGVAMNGGGGGATSPSTSRRPMPKASGGPKPTSRARSLARWGADSGVCERSAGARPRPIPDPFPIVRSFLLTSGPSRMAYIHPAWEEYQRQRFTRSDGDRYLKPPPFDHRAFIEEYRAAKAAEAARSAPVTCSLDDPEVRRLVSVEDLLRIVMMPSSSAARLRLLLSRYPGATGHLAPYR